MPNIGVVDLKAKVLANFTEMYRNSTVADVILVIGAEKIAVHRFVLASHSKFFQVLLYGQTYMESNQPHVKVEAPPNAMKMLVEFSYSGTLDLRTYDLPDVAKLLEIAHRYEFTELEKIVADYLCHAVDADNVVTILEMASLVDAEMLKERCWTVIEMIIEGIYDVEFDLSYALLMELLARGRRKTTEIKLFKIVHKMMQKFSVEHQKAIIEKIQFSRMMIDELFEVVEPTNILSCEKLLNIMKHVSLYKAQRLSEHIPVSKIGKVLKGINPENLFETGNLFTSHQVEDPASENCILLDLCSPYIINTIKLIVNKEICCSYYIEVSTDAMESWTRVVDITIFCRTYRKHQEHYFSDIIVRYIRFVGDDSLNFECNSVQIMYTQKPPKFLDGLRFPQENVAVPSKAVVEVMDSNKEWKLDLQLLDGKYQDEGIRTEFTKQIIENGSILIYFHQPYILSSCRFRLWDYDGRKYSYTVQTDNELISDKRDELVGGWQRIDFSPRVVNYFSITCVKASFENELRLVHFESPAQE